MRLIDADALPKHLGIEPTHDLEDFQYWVNFTAIDNAPTIDSIPVEWIKKKLDKLKDDIKWAWYYGNVALEKMEWAETWVQVVLLEEWEKENAQSS